MRHCRGRHHDSAAAGRKADAAPLADSTEAAHAASCEAHGFSATVRLAAVTSESAQGVLVLSAAPRAAHDGAARTRRGRWPLARCAARPRSRPLQGRVPSSAGPESAEEVVLRVPAGLAVRADCPPGWSRRLAKAADEWMMQLPCCAVDYREVWA